MAETIRPGLHGGLGDAIGDAAGGALRGASPWLTRGARLGYAASGVVYGTLGILTLHTALRGGGTTDSRGAIATLAEQPGGSLLLALVGVGLVALALWRVVAAATDAEGLGADAKGIAKRVGQAVRGLAYGALGVFALRMLAGHDQGGGEGTAGWTARLLALPAGRLLVAALGVAVVAYAFAQLRKAWTTDLDRHLDLHAVDADERRWIVRAGRLGIGARGVVFTIVGGFLVQAARRADAAQAGGLDEALAALAAAPFGAVLLAIVAIGFLAYGVYQFVRARYRRVATT